MSGKSQDRHWTHTLFQENAHLYLPFLEQAKERAPDETSILAGLFEELGVPAGGKVLDVACGIGRHSVPLAGAGYHMSGLDISELYVREAQLYAAEAGVAVNALAGDAREVGTLMADQSPFDAVISMFTSHGYYGRDADLDLFRQLHGLATNDGILIVLTSNRDWIIRNFEPEGVERAGEVRILQHRKLDLETSTMHDLWQFYEGERENQAPRLTLEMAHRLYSLHELRALLEEAGWDFLRGLGRPRGSDEALGPLTYEDNAMWVVARAKSPARILTRKCHSEPAGEESGAGAETLPSVQG